MIKTLKLKNLGVVKNLEVSSFGNINIFIGKNDSGKTMILKALYTIVKSLENFKKGDDSRSFKEILSEKTFWTFQVEKVGDLVSKDREDKSEHIQIEINCHNQKVGFSFSHSTTKNISNTLESPKNREANSIFIPAKEVLSLFSIIRNSRTVDKVFGFDDTFLDLVNALEKEPQKGRQYQSFVSSKEKLNSLLSGKITLKNGKWIFDKNKMKISIHSTAEGIKKIGVLDRLISNRFLTPESMVFIDEPEAFLHPQAILEFLDILEILSKNGIQIFIATHSYFVIKKLMIIAKKSDMDIPLISLLENGEHEISNLKTDVLDNLIIDTSIKLYEEEIEIEW